jgi:hypothetical protein
MLVREFERIDAHLASMSARTQRLDFLKVDINSSHPFLGFFFILFYFQKSVCMHVFWMRLGK